MRKRYQKGSLRKVEGKWIAQYWEDNHRRKKTLGLVSKVPRAQAQKELDAILGPINSRAQSPSAGTKFGDFMKNVYLPFYKRKWKRSTRLTNEDRLRVHLTPVYGERSLGSFGRDELQVRSFSTARLNRACPTVWSPTSVGPPANLQDGGLRRLPCPQSRRTAVCAKGRQAA